MSGCNGLRHCSEKLFNCQYVPNPGCHFQRLPSFPRISFYIFSSATPNCFQYTYLGCVLHRSWSYKHAISKLTAAGNRVLLAMQHWCSDLGIDDISLGCFLFSLLVQLALSYGCETWGLEHANSWECVSSVHHLFLKRSVHVRKSTPTEAVVCELGHMPLHLQGTG